MDPLTQKDFWNERWVDVSDLDALTRRVESDTRIRYVRRFLPPDGRILEAGCGDGKYVFYLRREGREAYGVDFSETAIERCRALATQSGAAPADAFRMGDVTRLDFPDGYFRAYLSMGVLEHFADGGAAAIREAFRTLEPGGAAIIAVPNRYSPWTPVRALASRFRPLVYQKNISRFTLRRAMESAGFRTRFCANADVAASFRMAFALESRRVRGIPNPFFHARSVLYGATGILERILPILGYHTLYVGGKE